MIQPAGDPLAGDSEERSCVARLSAPPQPSGGVFNHAFLNDLRARASPVPPTRRLTPLEATRVPLQLARSPLPEGSARDTAAAWLTIREHAALADTAHPDDAGETALLHAMETSPIVRNRNPPPPLDDGHLWLLLRLAEHWMALTRRSGDTRYLNAALNLATVIVLSGEPRGRSSRALDLADSALEVLEAIEDRPLSPLPSRRGGRLPALVAPFSGPGRVAVLAACDSPALTHFLDAARRACLPLHGVVLHDPDPTPSGTPRDWYPRGGPGTRRCAPVPPPEPIPTVTVRPRDWEAVAAYVRRWDTGLLIVFDHDTLPSGLLGVPAAATIRAHPGALPDYEGDDAVAWSLLAGVNPVCTVHTLSERPHPDGDVLATATVVAKSADLRSDMLDAQSVLLAHIGSLYTETGVLRRRKQGGRNRRWYPMNAALRSILDQRFRPTEPDRLRSRGAPRPANGNHRPVAEAGRHLPPPAVRLATGRPGPGRG